MNWDEFWLPRRVFSLAFMILVLVLGAAALAGAFVFDVGISEGQLNRAAAAKLPFERKTGAVVWRVESAELKPLANNRIAVEAQVRAATAAHEGEARASGSGIVTYREGAFWLRDIDVDSITVLGVHAVETPERKPSALGKALGGLVGRSETLQRALDGVKDKALSLGASEAEPLLNAWFKSVPVYRLRDDWKGNAARRTLLSLRTETGVLVATFDPVGEAFRIAAVAAIALVLLYAILCLVAAFTSWLGSLADALLFWW